MSRKSKAEYIGEKRRAYAWAGAAKRRQILDEVCETLCYTRKYVIKLMTGNVRYRERKGRGRTYKDEAVDLRPKPLSMRKRKARSVQYLTNQKLLRQI